MSTKNIIIFGETGTGKSSVINLMAGQTKAKTSPDAERCTMHWEEHAINFEGCAYRMFDTVGLDESQLGMKEYLDIIVNAYSLITKLREEGGVDLLLFCVRAGRVTATLKNNYRLFYEWLCEEEVPVVLVLTGLEREQRMEDWWDRNKVHFQKYRINVSGHACITAANKLDGRHKLLYEESRRLIRNLVIQHTHGRQEGAYSGGEGWYKSVIHKVWELTPGKSKPTTPKKKDILTILTKRCRMPPDVAKELAFKIRSDLTN